MLLLLTNKFNIGIKPRLPPRQHFSGPSSLPISVSEHGCYALQSQSRKAAPDNEVKKSPYCHSVAAVKILLYCFLFFKQSSFFIMYASSHGCLGKKKLASDPPELEIYGVPLVPKSNPSPLLNQQELVNTKLCL